MGKPLTPIDLLIIAATVIVTFISFRKIRELSLLAVILSFTGLTAAGLFLEKVCLINGKLIWSVNFIFGTGIFLKAVDQFEKSKYEAYNEKE